MSNDRTSCDRGDINFRRGGTVEKRGRMDGGIKRQTDSEPAGPSGGFSSGSTVIKTAARPVKWQGRHHPGWVVTVQTRS